MGLQDHSLDAILFRQLLLDLLGLLMVKSWADGHPVDLTGRGLDRLDLHRKIPLFNFLSQVARIIFITEGSRLNNIGRGMTDHRWARDRHR